MPEVYECDECGVQARNLKGWIICDHIGRRPKALICSDLCHALWASQAALEAEERAQAEVPKRPKRWWSRGRHG